MKTFMVILWQLVEFHQTSLSTLHFRPSLQVVHLLFSLLCFSLDAHTMSSIFVKEPLTCWLSALTQRLPAGSCLLNHPWPPALAHLILLFKKKKERERETQSPELWTPANLKRWIRREKLWLIWFGDKRERKANADFGDSTIAGHKKYARWQKKVKK